MSKVRGPELQIDRLVLELPGLDAARARVLAEAIAAGLAGADATGLHAELRGTLERPGLPPSDLARRIVAALLEGMA
jgi:hypothetical protein